jgi:hypothetical protein
MTTVGGDLLVDGGGEQRVHDGSWIRRRPGHVEDGEVGGSDTFIVDV